MRAREGFVLIAALWFVVALSTLGLEMSLRSRARRLAVANGLERAKAQAAAEAGIEDVRSCLVGMLRRDGAAGSREAWRSVADHVADPWHAAGACVADTVRLDDARYWVQVRDANALLNLRVAGEDQLRGFLRALRVDWGEADRLAQAVADWRDADEFRRARGAETEDYVRAGALVPPRNAPFPSVRELRDVRGVDTELFERAAAFMTVLGTGRVNINAAGEPVLLSLPGMTPAAVAAIHARVRAGRPFRTVQELTDALPLIARQTFLDATADFLRLAIFETRELEVISTGSVDGSPVHVLVTALFARAGNTAYLVWRRAE